MNISPRLLVVAVLMLSPSVVGCGAQTPEYYGVYLKQGGELHDVQKLSPEEAIIGDDTSIVVYEKAVASGDFDPLRHVRLFKTQPVRYEIETQSALSPFSQIVGLRLHGLRRIQTPGSPIALRARPVRGQSEMVELQVEELLTPGTYSLLFQDERQYVLRNTIQADEIYSAANPACYDRRTQTRDLSGTWGGYLQVAGAMAGSNSASGRMIMEEREWPCGKSDEFLNQGDTQEQLREFTHHAIVATHNAISQLSMAVETEEHSQEVLGLFRGAWHPVDVVKLSKLAQVQAARGRWFRVSLEGVAPQDGWGNPLECYGLIGSAIAVRSAGSDGKFEDDYTLAFEPYTFAEMADVDLAEHRRTSSENDYTGDLVYSTGLWIRAPAGW